MISPQRVYRLVIYKTIYSCIYNICIHGNLHTYIHAHTRMHRQTRPRAHKHTHACIHTQRVHISTGIRILTVTQYYKTCKELLEMSN